MNIKLFFSIQTHDIKPNREKLHEKLERRFNNLNPQNKNDKKITTE